jgi:glutathione S-transferase
MKLYGTSASPYVRKAMITAVEAGLDAEIENITPASSVWTGNGDSVVSSENPLGKIPVLVMRNGATLIDSSVICEYLASLAPEKNLLLSHGEDRWEDANFQSLAQGLMDAMVFRLAESNIRPEPYGWPAWAERQGVKVSRALDKFEGLMAGGSYAQPNLGLITLGSAMGYLEQRQGDVSWRGTRPALASWFDGFKDRPSMTSTIPPAILPPDQDPRRQ